MRRRVSTDRGGGGGWDLAVGVGAGGRKGRRVEKVEVEISHHLSGIGAEVETGAGEGEDLIVGRESRRWSMLWPGWNTWMERRAQRQDSVLVAGVELRV